MITYIDVIRRLQNEPYDSQKDNDDILSLYRFILENCADKEAFSKESASILDMINKDVLSDADEKKWIVYADNVFAIHPDRNCSDGELASEQFLSE